MKPLSSTSNFNIYLKRILAFLLALICLYAAAMVTASALESKYDTRNGTQKVAACQLADFYALEDDSVDVLVLGSSHAMCTYDPYAIKESFGLSCYNLGTALQQPDTAYFLLKEVLKTQKPKYLIYDVYFKVMQEEYSNEQVLTVLKELRSSDNALALFWSNLNMEGKVSYYNNWLNPFGKINSILENPTPLDNTPPAAYLGRGFYSSTSIVDPGLMTAEKHPFPAEYSGFNPRQVDYLKKLIALAQENDIEVILTSAPMPPSVTKRIAYYDDILKEAEEIAELFDVPFIDFAIPACDVLVDSDFADQGHLNRNGCAKFMKFFAEKMKANLS